MSYNPSEMEVLETREAELVRELEKIRESKAILECKIGDTFRDEGYYYRVAEKVHDGVVSGPHWLDDGDVIEIGGCGSFDLCDATPVSEAEFQVAWAALQSKIAKIVM